MRFPRDCRELRGRKRVRKGGLALSNGLERVALRPRLRWLRFVAQLAAVDEPLAQKDARSFLTSLPGSAAVEKCLYEVSAASRMFSENSLRRSSRSGAGVLT